MSPTTGLDPQARRNFWELIQSIKARQEDDHPHYALHGRRRSCWAMRSPSSIVSDHRARPTATPAARALRRSHAGVAQTGLPGERARAAAANHRYGGTIEITTDDLDTTLRTLIDAHVPLTTWRIRPANLEDLFLELTGKELRA